MYSNISLLNLYHILSLKENSRYCHWVWWIIRAVLRELPHFPAYAVAAHSSGPRMVTWIVLLLLLRVRLCEDS